MTLFRRGSSGQSVRSAVRSNSTNPKKPWCHVVGHVQNFVYKFANFRWAVGWGGLAAETRRLLLTPSLYDIYCPTRWKEIDQQRDEWKYIRFYSITTTRYQLLLDNWYTIDISITRLLNTIAPKIIFVSNLSVWKQYVLMEMISIRARASVLNTYYRTENYRPNIVVKQRFWLVQIIPRILGTRTNCIFSVL